MERKSLVELNKLLFVFVLFISTSAFSQKIIPKKIGSYEKPVYAKHYLGILLSPTTQSEPITYLIYTFYYDSTKNYKTISKNTFISQLMGAQKCDVNPNQINYFAKNNIDPMVLEYIWKVRYHEYPFGKKTIPGWSNGKYIPSKNQMNMLKQFGINSLSDVIYGDNLINFLHSLSDVSWVNQYKAK